MPWDYDQTRCISRCMHCKLCTIRVPHRRLECNLPTDFWRGAEHEKGVLRVKSRTTYHHGDLKQALVDEGRRLIDEEGYERFSLRKLATRIGVSPMAPYRHFESKEDLLGAIVDNAFEQFANALEESVPPEAPLQEQMTRMCIGYVRFFVAHPDILKILFMEVGTRNRALESQHNGENLTELMRTQRSFDMYHALAERMAHLYPDLAEGELILMIWARAHGIAILLAQETWYFDPRTFSDEAIGRIIRMKL